MATTAQPRRRDPDGGHFTYRLVGTQIVDLLGVDPTGCWSRPHGPKKPPTLVVEGYRDVVETRTPVFCQQINGWLEDQKPTAWAMRLPLSSNGKDVDMILAYLSDNIGMLSSSMSNRRSVRTSRTANPTNTSAEMRLSQRPKLAELLSARAAALAEQATIGSRWCRRC